jgi:uncharacterized DUF497 family protein
MSASEVLPLVGTILCLRPTGAPREAQYMSRSDRRPRSAPVRQDKLLPLPPSLPCLIRPPFRLLEQRRQHPRQRNHHAQHQEPNRHRPPKRHISRRPGLLRNIRKRYPQAHRRNHSQSPREYVKVPSHNSLPLRIAQIEWRRGDHLRPPQEREEDPRAWIALSIRRRVQVRHSRHSRCLEERRVALRRDRLPKSAVHVLIFIETADGIRVISFRRANRREVWDYEQSRRNLEQGTGPDR